MTEFLTGEGRKGMSRGTSTYALLKVSKKAMNNPQKTLGEILMIRIAIVGVCEENRISGTSFGIRRMQLIPNDAEKPIDITLP